MQVPQARLNCAPDANTEFDTAEFLQYLASYKISDSLQAIAGGKRKAVMLYRAFIDGHNFPAWRENVRSDVS